MICREKSNWERVTGCSGVVPLLEYHQSEDAAYYVTEYCVRGSLTDWIDGIGHDDGRTVLWHVLSGLKGCHDRGVAHCDVKPANILHGGSEGWKLCDFGNSQSTTQATKGIFVARGTPAFAAPEIFAGVEHGTSVDVWAIGVLAWVLWAKGKGHPFLPSLASENISRAAYVNRVRRCRFDWPAGAPQDLKDFVEHCCKNEPSERLVAAEAAMHPYVRRF